jgi:hypothetical protein
MAPAGFGSFTRIRTGLTPSAPVRWPKSQECLGSGGQTVDDVPPGAASEHEHVCEDLPGE